VTRPALEWNTWAVECIHRVPVTLATSHKIPGAVVPRILVEIANRHDDPFARIFMLGTAINVAMRVVRSVELYVVAADQMDGAVESAQLGFDGAAQSFASASMAAAIHMRHEKLQPGIDIAPVHRQRIAYGQLLDRQRGFDTVDPGLQAGVCGQRHWILIVVAARVRRRVRHSMRGGADIRHLMDVPAGWATAVCLGKRTVRTGSHAMPEPLVFRNRLQGRVAIVTGAGSQGVGAGVGTGKAIALLFAGEGARVCLVDREPGRAEETLGRIDAAGGHAFVVAADVTQSEDCQRIVAETTERFGGVDVLVNNVGLAGQQGDFSNFDEAAWERMFFVNLKSALLMCRYVVPAMITRGGGAVVNISSIAGILAHGTFAYGPSKAAMEHFSREIAVVYGRQGIRANTVAPGHIQTPLVAGLLPESLRKTRRKVGPLGLEGDAWDVAYAALFLASDEARFITGQRIAVDGGVTATAPMAAHDLISEH
jgi:NAD(P)-dependent dehydrogenase (short-subunit alcohol dehydrogenase family)